MAAKRDQPAESPSLAEAARELTYWAAEFEGDVTACFYRDPQGESGVCPACNGEIENGEGHRIEPHIHRSGDGHYTPPRGSDCSLAYFRAALARIRAALSADAERRESERQAMAELMASAARMAQAFDSLADLEGGAFKAAGDTRRAKTWHWAIENGGKLRAALSRCREVVGS